MIIRKYWTIASTSWQRAMSYRVNTLLEIVGYLTTMTISIVLWRFAFEHTGLQEIKGYTVQEMIVYLLIAGWITSIFWFTAQAERIVHEIKEGVVSNYLVKPMRLSLYYFIYGNAGKFMQFIWGSLAFVVVLIVFRLYVDFAYTQFHIGLFVIFLIVAWLIQWLIFYSVALLAFWFEEVWGVAFIIRVLSDVAAGAFLPLSLFSPSWQQLFDWLPFKYIISVPVNVLMGRISGTELLSAFGGAVVWLVTLILFAQLAMRRGIQRYGAVGR